jgi:hypothetical protein
MSVYLTINRTKCTSSHCTQQPIFPKNHNTLARFEPGSSVPLADAMTTAPRVQKNRHSLLTDVSVALKPSSVRSGDGKSTMPLSSKLCRRLYRFIDRFFKYKHIQK